MDFGYASGRLSVKIAEQKKMEVQIHSLAGKKREEMIAFLNHLQLAGNGETSDFTQIIQGSEKVLYEELKSLCADDQLYILDAVFADEIITFLNLKLNNVTFQERFKPFDVIHLSLFNLLNDHLSGKEEHYLKMIHQVKAKISEKGRRQEAYLTRVFYQYLREFFPTHLFIESKENAINLRSLFRAKTLQFSLDEFSDELLGDDIKREKFLNLFRLDERQVISTLKEKFDQSAADTYEAIVNEPKNMDVLIDRYLEGNMKKLVFSSDYLDLMLLYGYQKKRLMKMIKDVYNREENA